MHGPPGMGACGQLFCCSHLQPRCRAGSHVHSMKKRRLASCSKAEAVKKVPNISCSYLLDSNYAGFACTLLLTAQQLFICLIWQLCFIIFVFCHGSLSDAAAPISLSLLSPTCILN